MRWYKHVEKIERVLGNIQCNKCGRDLLDEHVGDDLALHVYHTGCYHSPVLEDCTSYEFDLCEYCLQELMDSFKIPVEKKEIPI